MTNSAKAYLTEKELAARWGISIKTLQAHRLKGTGVGFYKLFGVKYALEEVLAYERDHRRTSTSEEVAR